MKNLRSTGAGAALIVAVCLVAAANTPAIAIEPDAPSRLISIDEVIGIELQQKLNRTVSGLSAREKSERKDLAQFYAARSNLPIWVSSKGLNSRAQTVMSEIRKAGDWALPVTAFELPRLPPAQPGAAPLPRRLLADAELKLSLTVLKYARFARGGRTDPAKISYFLDRKPELLDAKIVMERISSAADPAAALRAFHPKHRQFLALLKQYRAMTNGTARAAQKSTDKTKLPGGPTLKKGMRHVNVAILRKRLGVVPDDPENSNKFDDALYEAVRTFQKKHALDVDGVVGPGTRRVLNGGPVKGDPRKLLVNIEQWRWMPQNLGRMHIWVNIPEFKIRVVKDGKIIHTERIVVGKTLNQTPIFSKSMKWIEFHPSWYVPTSIKVQEIGPNLRRSGSSFLKRMNMVMECPRSAYGRRKKKNFWESEAAPAGVDIAKCNVKQLPGPKNVLGMVKFKFPNKHSVYLHDTTSKSLFKRSVRAYSHGCVRVRNPIKLAEIILSNDQNMSKAKIRSIVNGPVQTYQAYLKKDLPVHVTYFTAVANEAGKISYFRDVYRHEKRIALAMAGKYNQISPVPVNRTPIRVAKKQVRPRKRKKNLFEQIFSGFN